ncbi:hypothetical protein V496_03457, partial [Pseudogymnoascus sp. VKM F-4515 (FW-2607)]
MVIKDSSGITKASIFSHKEMNSIVRRGRDRGRASSRGEWADWADWDVRRVREYTSLLGGLGEAKKSTSIVVLNSMYEITKTEVGEGKGGMEEWEMEDGRSERGDGTLICTFTRGVTAACGNTN